MRIVAETTPWGDPPRGVIRTEGSCEDRTPIEEAHGPTITGEANVHRATRLPEERPGWGSCTRREPARGGDPGRKGSRPQATTTKLVNDC
jgi:hypothetical protein